MSVCAICLDTLKAPVALPCGHVYCYGCISETVKVATSSSSSTIRCPTCREPVSTVAPDTLIPPHLRPYVLPPFRRIYLSTPAPSFTLPDSERETSIARLHMENAALRQSCYAWHARAHAHMAAHFQLTALVRVARDQAQKLKDDRNEIARKYDSLKRKLSDIDRDLEHETKTNQEEHVLIWNEMTPKAQDEAQRNLQTTPENVPCVRLISPVSRHEVQGNAKRPRISPAAVFPEPELLAKSATSIPAMIIPHLVSDRTSTRSMLFHN